jgi:hypothetical protein
MPHVPYKLHVEIAKARTTGLTGWLKGASRKYFNVAFGNSVKKQLRSALDKLSLYCQPPDPKAENATDLNAAMRQFTWWPDMFLLKQIQHSVLTLAKTERKDPERQRPWKMFELVDKRNLKLHLIDQINALAGRAKCLFLEANFSDLEALSWELGKDKNAQSLLRDIDRITEDISAGKAIDWAQYEAILSKVSGNGHLARVGGDNIKLACYARVLELIVDHRKWAKLRKDSEPLVYWLLEIGYPRVSGREGLVHFNREAVFGWLWEEARRRQQRREARLEKLRQSGFHKEWDEESREDARLMGLIARGDLKALETLKKRYWGMVGGIVFRVMRDNHLVEDIALLVFDKIRVAAREKYDPAPGFRYWLSTIARNTAIDQLRRHRKANPVRFSSFEMEGEPGLWISVPDDPRDWSWQPPGQ